MAAAAQATHVPVEVYLNTSWEPDAEYVDGIIEERPRGQYDHSSWQHAMNSGLPSTRRNGTSGFDQN
jgi:hypothetical protein